jgi:protein-tyrosine phosphatase
MEESLLNSLQTKLKYRQDLENGDIWSATDIYHSKIYLGNGYDACNYQELMNKKISHILNCTNDVPNYFEDDDNLSISYLKLDVLDFGVDQGISRVFPEAIRFIQDVVNDKDNGNCILIHCANGSNRSVTIAIAVLMVLNGILPLSLSLTRIIRLESLSVMESCLFLTITSCTIA